MNEERDSLRELVERARGAEPPPLSEASRARMLRAARAAALEDRAVPRRAAGRRLGFMLALAGSLVAVAALAYFGAQPREPERESFAELVLPTGDRVSATADARWRIVALADERRLQVDEGEVLFDVEPLSPGEEFVVSSGAVEVRVRGTVFSVRQAQGAVGRSSLRRSRRCDPGGALDVRGRRRALEQYVWRGSGSRVRRPRTPGPLDAVAERAVARRRGGAPSVALQQSEPPDAAPRRQTHSRPSQVRRPRSISCLSEGVQVETRSPPRTRGPSGAATSAGRRPERWDPRRQKRACGPERVARRTPSRSRVRLVALVRRRTSGSWSARRRRAPSAVQRRQRVAYEARRSRRSRTPPFSLSGGATPLRPPSRTRPARSRRWSWRGRGEGLLERRLGLEARALHRLGRRDAFRAAAERYLRRYPAGGLAEWMRAQLDALQAPPTPEDAP